jgi:hypothetical protein
MILIHKINFYPLKIKTLTLSLLFITICFCYTKSQNKQGGMQSDILSGSNFEYLEGLTKDVVDSSRINQGQIISSQFGPNNTGGILIRPGGRECYPSFWIRDYAMSLECGFINNEEQKHMLLLTASTQCDQPWITKGGSMVPYGAIADHVRIDDGLPVYFPGTYSYIEQGNKTFGMFPPYDDQFFFIHMAYCYIKSTADYKILSGEINDIRLIDRLESAYKVPPSRPDNQIIYTSDEYRGVDFGFRDVIQITGDLCFSSILKFRASNELAEMFEIIKNKSKASNYRNNAEKIKSAIPALFLDKRGMLVASTGKSRQADVWSTALAVYLNILEGSNNEKACRFLAEAYKKGLLAYNGNIRHILTSDDYNDKTAWEISLAEKNTYQNGAYWGTPTGWVCFSISQADFSLAQRLAEEYIEDLRKNDFRKGGKFGAPYECFHPSGFRQNPVYMTTVTCPFIVFRSMNNIKAISGLRKP